MKEPRRTEPAEQADRAEEARHDRTENEPEHPPSLGCVRDLVRRHPDPPKEEE